MDTAIVLFTRDLRPRDNPALHAACAPPRSMSPVTASLRSGERKGRIARDQY
jgi:deoxyribodipyrimidine photolyase